MRRMLLLGLAFLFLLPAGAVLAQSADADGETCRYAQDRATAAVLRARRAVARTNIAALRVTAELAAAGQPAPELKALILEAPPAAPDKPSFVEMASIAWDLKRYAERVGMRSQAEMDRRLRPLPPSAGFGPTIEDKEEELWRPKKDAAVDCLGWKLYVERAAFRAEQSAQLADVAADQAIALRDQVVRNRPR
jgi:hypothetical protein